MTMFGGQIRSLLEAVDTNTTCQQIHGFIINMQKEHLFNKMLFFTEALEEKAQI